MYVAVSFLLLADDSRAKWEQNFPSHLSETNEFQFTLFNRLMADITIPNFFLSSFLSRKCFGLQTVAIDISGDYQEFPK